MFDFIEKAKERERSLTSIEQGLGKSLYQPCTDANSGSRKLMASTQLEHAMPLYHGEISIFKAGYEERYGDYSSAIIKTDNNVYEVVGKVSKFQDLPNHEYYLILRDLRTNRMSMIHRISYNYSSETYGYLYDNRKLDSLDISYEIHPNEVLRTSTSVDDFGNRKDGVNLKHIYMVNEITKEDGMAISTEAREKLASPLFRKVSILLNDNDILLNTMGKDAAYKSFPCIGEYIEDGMLLSVRREQSDTALFTQSIDILKRPLMSDDKYTIESGRVIDITIESNNPDVLADKHTNSEVLYYYNDHIRFIKEFVSTVDRICDKYDIPHIHIMDRLTDDQLSTNSQYFDYDLEKLYTNSMRELRGYKFMEDGKEFNGTRITFMVEDKNLPNIGDKITNRYGGKGVIVEIRDVELMPKDPDTLEPAEIIMNGCTCPNRTNAGQAHEASITYIDSFLIQYFKMNVLSSAEIMQMITVFISYISVEEAVCVSDYFNNLSAEDKDMYIQQVLDDGYIQISAKPISESVTQDIIAQIYKEFPFIHQKFMLVPQIGSNGNYRYIYSRRPVVMGRMYIYRLKQYAEEKFSVTSLSSTNLRGENSRNKLNKNYKALYPATPIQFGYMEADEFGHLGFETVIETMMIHSLSPQARMLVEKLYVDDPYSIDIRLDSDSKNRSAEQVNAYLKAIGTRLLFTKTKKIMKNPFTIDPIVIHNPPKAVIKRIHPKENFDIDKWIKFTREIEEKKKSFPFTIDPIIIDRDKKK